MPALAPPLADALIARLAARLPRAAGQCAVCRRWSPQRLCSDCAARYATAVPRCHFCALRLPPGAGPACGSCLRAPPPLSHCIAALDYGFPWDRLLQRFKFHDALHWRALLVELLDRALGDAEAPDLLLPIPLTASRLRERGYNQSLEIARGLAQRRQWRCAAGLLLRVRDTAQQASLQLDARRANMQHAFAVEPAAQAGLRGAKVALVDDVMTSGATLFEAAGALRRAGAASVQAWVLARTPAD